MRLAFLLKPVLEKRACTVPQTGVDLGADTTENVEIQKHPRVLQFGDSQETLIL